jgi:aspartyl-tRNA(Asn)/glutamyl-tRNA(Gln) amidotransferase subunit C
MKLRLEDIDHLASLARLELSDADREKYDTDLNSVLRFVASLPDVSSQINNFATISNLTNIFDTDLVRPSLARDLVLKNAPLIDGQYLKVKAVLDNDN